MNLTCEYLECDEHIFFYSIDNCCCCIMYCDIVWNICSTTNINSLLLLQKRAIRNVTHSHYLSHTEPSFKYSENTTYIHLTNRHIHVYIHFQSSPITIQNRFILNSTIHSYIHIHPAILKTIN